jgi:hypothetical protein
MSTESPARSFSFVSAADDNGPVAVVEDDLHGDDFARQVGAAGHDDAEGLVEHHFVAALEVVGPQGRVEGDAHLAAARKDVGGAVVVAAQERPISGRRLGELVHLLAEGGDVLAGLTQGVGQALVLREGLLQLALGLQETLFQRPHPLGRISQSPPQQSHLLLQSSYLRLQRTGFGLKFGPPLVLATAIGFVLVLLSHPDHLPFS